MTPEQLEEIERRAEELAGLRKLENPPRRDLLSRQLESSVPALLAYVRELEARLEGTT